MPTAQPIRYDMPLYRPPSEHDALILQVTLGCSHNDCTFCEMYQTKRFSVREPDAVLDEIAWGRDQLGTRAQTLRKVFLADGDAFVLKPRRLLPLLDACHAAFPAARISAYAQPSNILKKSDEELAALRDAGLTRVYVGVESGDPDTLSRLIKGATDRAIIDSILKAEACGIEVSATVLLGVGGADDAGMRQHADATARVLSEASPSFAAALVCTVAPDDPRFYDPMPPGFQLPDRRGTLVELRRLIEQFAPFRPVEFRSNHASNHLALKGRLPADRDALLAAIDRVLGELDATGDSRLLRPEWARGL